MTSTPDSRQVLTALGIPDAFQGDPQLWAEAMAALPPTADIPFLNPTTLPRYLAKVGLPPQRLSPLQSVINLIVADPNLTAYAWYLYWRVFLTPEQGAPWGAPDLTTRLADLSGALYLLVALEFIPALTAWHRKLGYSASVTDETLRQLSCFEWYHLNGTGLPGLYPRHLMWLNCYLTAPYVRLGRFEYQMQPYSGQTEVWHRAADNQLVALAPPDLHVTPQGLITAAPSPDHTTWLTSRHTTASQASGYPIHPSGHIINHLIHLNRPEWSPLLRKESTILNMHIPAGGSMNWDAVSDSFRRAEAFFTRHHPDKPLIGSVMGTWFLDPQLNRLLPATANPLQFQRACYLFPTPPAPGGLWFIFQRDIATTPPHQLPQKTSIQRTLANFLAKGGQWHGGAMFIPFFEMKQLQENRYTSRFNSLYPDFSNYL